MIGKDTFVLIVHDLRIAIYALRYGLWIDRSIDSDLGMLAIGLRSLGSDLPGEPSEEQTRRQSSTKSNKGLLCII